MNLGPGTRQHDLEDLLALGMKNYGVRRLRSRRQASLRCIPAMPFAEAFAIRVLLDNGVNSFGSNADKVLIITE